MKKILSKENIGFGGLQWFFWSGYCTLFAFLVLYLKTKNYDEVQIGFVMSAISVASIVGQPFWGHHSDRRNEIKNILVVCFIISGVAALLIPVYYRSFTIVILICLIISFTENSMPSIIDSWTMNVAIERPWIDYGLTRGMGSLGYSLTAVIFGIMLDKFGYQLMFYTHFVFILLTVGVCFLVDNISKSKPLSAVFNRNGFANLKMRNSSTNFENRSMQEENKIYRSKVLKIMSNAIPDDGRTSVNSLVDSDSNDKVSINIKESGTFIWFLLSSTLVFIGFRATATFYPLLLSQKGGDNKDMGLSLFIMAISEVPVLFLSKRLIGKFKDTAIITVSMFFFILRIFLHIVVPSISGLIAVQATQALSFALFLPASVYYIKRIAPEGRGSTYLTVAASCYFGIGGIIGNIAGGFIIDNSNIYTMLWSGTALAVIGLFVFILSNKQAASKVTYSPT